MRNLVAVIILALASAALWLAPEVQPAVEGTRRGECAEVVSVDDADLQLHGYLQYGTQRLRVRLKDGREFDAENQMLANPELDKSFAPGDEALVIVPDNAEAGTVLVARDHWRIWRGGIVFGVFCLLLIIVGGWTGIKALFSLLFSCLAVWKMLVPLTLKGYPASLVSFGTVAVLTAVIMYLVAGFSRKGWSAFLGSMLGVAASFGLAHYIGMMLHIDGRTMPYALQVVNSGYGGLDLRDIFFGAIVLASSGAVMDLGMDIAAGMEEVKRHCMELGFKELLKSGLRIGRAVIGTMTTTLLLAYSGGYLTLLMKFAAEGTHPIDFLNSTLVSAEVVKTLVGSFGLVLVAPFTAFVGAIAFASMKAPGTIIAAGGSADTMECRIKAVIRKEMRSRRKALTSSERSNASVTVSGRLSAIHFPEGSPVAVYLASGDEISLRPFILVALARGMELVAPRWNGKEYELAKLESIGSSSLRKGPMGVLEPKAGDIVSPELVKAWVVPGLAFTRSGARLGYGGGWYDRLMEKSPADSLRIGVCHAFQIVDALPTEMHDVTMTGLVVAGEPCANSGFMV